MTDIIVPERRTVGRKSGMLAGRPVSGLDWRSVVDEHNWTRSRGRILVPFCWTPNITDNDVTVAYRVHPSIQAVQNVVHFTGMSGSAADPQKFSIDHGSDTWEVNQDYTNGAVIDYIEKTVEYTQSESKTADTFRAYNTGGEFSTADYYVGLQQWEIPRYQLTVGTTDHAANPATMSSGQPVKRDSFARLIEDNDQNHLDVGNRCLGQILRPHLVSGSLSTTYAVSTSSSSWANSHNAIPALGRVRYLATTTMQVEAWAYAWVSSGGSGQIRVTTSSGGSGSATTVTNTTGLWTSCDGTTIDSEDLTSSVGWRSSTFDTIRLEFRATAGTLYVASTAFFEDPA